MGGIRGVSAPHAEGGNAGFRPRTPRSFCFGKRTQNHWRPGVALRVPLPQSRLLGLRNSLRSDSPRPQIGSGPGRSHARRRPEVAPWDGGGYMQKQRGRAALDAAPTTTNYNDSGSPMGAGGGREKAKTKDTGSRIESGTSVEDDRKGKGGTTRFFALLRMTEGGDDRGRRKRH